MLFVRLEDLHNSELLILITIVCDFGNNNQWFCNLAIFSGNGGQDHFKDNEFQPSWCFRNSSGSDVKMDCNDPDFW